MGPQERHSKRQGTDRRPTPYKGKRTPRPSLRTPVIGAWLRGAGITLFLGCPYLHHALISWFGKTPAGAFYTVTGPILIFAMAFWLYSKGEELRED